MQRTENIKSIMDSMRSIRRNMMSFKKHKANMTHAQWGILHSVMHEEAQNVKDLAERFNLSKSAITQHINTLVEKGLITRKENPQDRRHIILKITPTFKKKSQALHSKMIEQMGKLFEPLSDKELQEFARLHKKIHDHFSSTHSHS
mgnify:CR=1 FL=1